MEIANAVVVLLATGCSAVFCRTDGEFAYGLTAAHCSVVEGEAVSAKYRETPFGCRVLKVDHVRDMALLKCYAHVLPKCSLPVAAARPGEVVLVGFPAGKLKVMRGRMTRESRLMGASGKQVVVTQEPVVGGFSGGAVISEEGLVGVVTHSCTVQDAASGRCESGAGCSLTDRLLEAGVKRSLEAEPISGLSVRDLIAAVVGLLVSKFWGRFFPGSPAPLSAVRRRRKP